MIHILKQYDYYKVIIAIVIFLKFLYNIKLF